MVKNKARVFALYLPQFHPIPENDLWWGKGFTEWTNVGKAQKMFRGHYQPRVPADLGYYDLRIPEVREEQAKLANEAGVEGFIYWHYWFGNGKRLMERPFDEVLSSGCPNFPFALAWANATWKGFIYGDKGRNELISQEYPGEKDYIDHFNQLLTAFTDPRYIRIKDKPIFMIFQPFDLPECDKFIKLWQELSNKNGLNGIHFIAQTDDPSKIDELIRLGFSSVNLVRLFKPFNTENKAIKAIKKILTLISGKNKNVKNYKECMKFWTGPEDSKLQCIPSLFPNWDHSPRSGSKGIIIHGSTPELFEKHCHDVLAKIKNKPFDERIIILKSWNEWAEGNYMEPDLIFGKRYIKALGEALK